MNYFLSFRNVEVTLKAFLICRNHGIDCTIDMGRINFHNEDEQQLAAGILPSFGINPRFN
jgi:hypothetical protein